MLDDSLLGYLLLNLGLLMLTATALTEIKPLRTILKRQERSVSNQLLLGLIFGLLSISGTYTSLGLQGALVNTRVVSTLAAGLVGMALCRGGESKAEAPSTVCALDLSSAVTEAMLRSVKSTAMISGYVIFFSMLTALMRQSGLFTLLAGLLCAAAMYQGVLFLEKALKKHLGVSA